MYAVLYILALVALAGFGGWYASTPDWEPAIGIITSLGSLIALYLNDDIRKAKASRCSEKRKSDVAAALSRIKREASNLQHMATGNEYKGEGHRKIVEEFSMDLLARDLSPLTAYWRYSRLVRRVLAEVRAVQEASSKSVCRLQPLVHSLEARLKSD